MAYLLKTYIRLVLISIYTSRLYFAGLSFHILILDKQMLLLSGDATDNNIAHINNYLSTKYNLKLIKSGWNVRHRHISPNIQQSPLKSNTQNIKQNVLLNSNRGAAINSYLEKRGIQTGNLNTLKPTVKPTSLQKPPISLPTHSLANDASRQVPKEVQSPAQQPLVAGQTVANNACSSQVDPFKGEINNTSTLYIHRVASPSFRQYMKYESNYL